MQTMYDAERIKRTFAECRGALADVAFKSHETRGRRYKEDRDSVLYDAMDPFDLDEWKITHSKSYRRANDKTQVFANPWNAHVRRRGEHMNETAANSVLPARVLGLNIHLCRAIGRGHDIGHVPYGHAGEDILSELSGRRVKHPQHGVFVAQHIERKGKGLNLTYETLLGIAQHSRGAGSLNQGGTALNEFELCMLVDKLSYLYADYNDVKRTGLMDEHFTHYAIEALGRNQTERTFTVIEAIVRESAEKGRVSFSEGETYEMFEVGRKFMWKSVYELIDWESHKKDMATVHRIMDRLFICPRVDPTVLVSLMTDSDIEQIIMHKKHNLRIDERFLVEKTSVGELLPQLYNKEFEYWEQDLDWAGERDRKSGLRAASEVMNRCRKSAVQDKETREDEQVCA